MGTSDETPRGQDDSALGAWRRTLKQLNTNPPPFSGSKKLDGSIKKNSAFVKKLRGPLSAETLPGLKREMDGLTLEKYLAELIVALTETRFKSASDAQAGADLISSLHQRFYPDLSKDLMPALYRAFSTAVPNYPPDLSPELVEKEETARIGRLRSALRLVIELYLVGLFHPKFKEASLSLVIKELLLKDKELWNASMAVLIVKSYKFVLLPKELSASSSSMKDLIQASQQDAVRSTLITYFQTLSARLVKEVSAMNHLEISNQESSIAKGFLSDERKEKMDKAQKLVEKLTVSTQTLAQGLGQVMPDLPKLEDAAVKHHGVTIVDTGLSFAAANEAANNFWENEETRTFYTDIPDLKNLVPPACLDIVDAAQATDDPSKSVAALLESTLSGDLADPTGLEDDLADSTEPTVSQFDSVMAMLQGTVMNREIIDQVAIDFALVNSKGTKKRLAKFIVDSHRKRSDLIPYLARLLAILNPYIPDVGALVLQPTVLYFKRFVHSKDKAFLDFKINTIRFVGELTKFSAIPLHVTFHVLKSLLDDFAPVMIEILCIFLETCGRFLYLTPLTSAKTASYLEILMKKRSSVLNVDSRLALMIDNAFFQCKPPENTMVTVRKVYPPVELFLRKLLFVDLSRSTVDQCLLILRKLDWNDTELVAKLSKLFREVWEFKFSQLDFLAFLTAELSEYHPEFSIGVVDAVLEDIWRGLQTNIFGNNQKRVAQVKFLGELYNFKMFDHTIIFDTLYLILTFGYEHGMLHPDSESPFDGKKDYFRIRLCSMLLETSGAFFKNGRTGRKLDRFLAFFQLYIHTKPKPPMDIDFIIQDIFEFLRPKITLCKDYIEAATLVNSMIELEKQEPIEAEQDEEEADVTPQLEDVLTDDEEDATSDEDSDDSDDSFSEDDSEDEESSSEDYDEDEEEEELDMDFDKEFSRMLLEGRDQRKAAEKKSSTFDASIPLRNRPNIQELSRAQEVTFTLLTKKGQKQQSKQISLPASSTLVVSTLSKQVADLKEKEEMKRIVLDLEKRSRT